jgi:hypothetical protein
MPADEGGELNNEAIVLSTIFPSEREAEDARAKLFHGLWRYGIEPVRGGFRVSECPEIATRLDYE